MLYPTGKTTGNRCLVCMEDEKPQIEECLSECGTDQMFETFKKWLDENSYCVECWQMKEYLQAKGVPADRIDEDMGAGAPAAPSAPAGGAAGSAFATLGSTPGMGIAAPPTNGGTNAGFYDASKDGSGDKFPSLAVGTPAAASNKKRKNRAIASYLDFIKKKKK